MKFWKYHGIGNDFVLIDGMNTDIEIDNERCRLFCDRNYGIGADGVVFLMPGEGTDIGMRIINADGTEAEMCGNGIRCLAKHAYDFGIVDKEEFAISTQAGVKRIAVSLDGGKVTTVRVDMGAPILDGRTVPIDYDGEFIDQPFALEGYSIRGNAVSMGNPHFITFSDLSDNEVERLGPILEAHPFFPKKTNVEFCRIQDGNIHIKVYERGAGWTLACGTGACASATAAALNGLVPFDEPVDVRLPGGWLKITVSKGLDRVYMEGPATLVYEGDIREE
ncbi:MAG: diaminopimelate epimerase [Candidatus Methanoplasma sp.]|jgi:diaminopimelate epimerase|nr:diaminopimelate epimerase [Candidatus Methanoplasma sp.]